jgi:hypothetical protein
MKFPTALCLCGIVLVAATEAGAQSYHVQPYNQAPRYLPPPPPPAQAPSGYWRDRSGTADRMGLGADPYHPEGPGNPRMGW